MARLIKLLKNELITGLVLMAPIAGTAYLVVLIVRSVDAWIPEEFRPRVMGYPVPGLGLIAVLVLALFVGVFAHNFIGRRLVGLFDKMFSKIPLFGGTY